MAVKDVLVTAHANAAARLAEVLASQAPSYSVDGQSVSRSEYASMLKDQLDALWKQIIATSGPCSAQTRGKS